MSTSTFVDPGFLPGTKDDLFYYPDGNIILAVGDSSTGRLFRVVKGHLAQHSEFFRNMSLIPQPFNDTATITLDGCPVVQMHDRVEDVRSTFELMWCLPYT